MIIIKDYSTKERRRLPYQGPNSITTIIEYIPLRELQLDSLGARSRGFPHGWRVRGHLRSEFSQGTSCNN